MSLKFTALEVGSGDAFLLEDGDRKILFDSGGSKTKIVALLKKKGITKIDLAICSHNDVDHANGFIGLLDSSSGINLEELWLPGVMANVLQFVIDHRDDLEDVLCEIDHHLLRRESWTSDFMREGYELGDLFGEESVSVDSFDDQLSYISEIYETDLLNMTSRGNFLYYLSHYWGNEVHSYVIQWGRILKLAALAYQSGCKIRWFEPNNGSTGILIDYNFIALNSRPIRRVRKIKSIEHFLYALTLTNENKYSLVFEFVKDNNPIIRFSADSNIAYQSQCPYQNCIIVTAPHHGSEANAIVYDTKDGLKGNDIIWVRSDRKSRERPCTEFKDQKKKYCLACYSKNFQKEICFKYVVGSKQWHCQEGTPCVC